MGTVIRQTCAGMKLLVLLPSVLLALPDHGGHHGHGHVGAGLYHAPPPAPPLSSFQMVAHNMSSTTQTTIRGTWRRSPMRELPISLNTTPAMAMVAMDLRVNSPE